MKAMVFAAGLGTRLRPITDSMPKALVPVCGEPLLYHVICKLRDAGYDDIVVNVHHFAGQIREYLAANDFGVRISISDETDLLRETGSAVDRSNFYPVDTARVPGTGDSMMLAELVFDRLNMGLPLDFHGYTPSVGDIIAIKSHGAVSFFYVEQIGFSELPHFLEPENYLKNAEMAEEDDLGMIDGIINNGKKPDIADLERRVQEGKAISVEELAEAAKQARDNAQNEPPRQSLLDKLHRYQEEQKKPTAAPKLAERNQEKC